MKKVLLRILGAICIIFGVLVIGWVFYNLIFGITDSAKQSSGNLPPVLKGIMVFLLWGHMIKVGFVWIRGKTLAEHDRELKEKE